MEIRGVLSENGSLLPQWQPGISLEVLTSSLKHDLRGRVIGDISTKQTVYDEEKHRGKCADSSMVTRLAQNENIVGWAETWLNIPEILELISALKRGKIAGALWSLTVSGFGAMFCQSKISFHEAKHSEFTLVCFCDEHCLTIRKSLWFDSYLK